jgi:hypothetical protein
MAYIEGELFQDKRRNLAMFKGSYWILFEQSPDGIY